MEPTTAKGREPELLTTIRQLVMTLIPDGDDPDNPRIMSKDWDRCDKVARAIEAEARAEQAPLIEALREQASDALLQTALLQEALVKIAEEGCTGCEFNADDPDGDQFATEPVSMALADVARIEFSACSACIARVALLADTAKAPEEWLARHDAEVVKAADHGHIDGFCPRYNGSCLSGFGNG